ncbi:hypothetical protein CJZ35_26070 [Salmonella enterica subsp. enterica serovar Braenderup]|nr:hypothetical protein CJZ35_26070 [Salmonella enterica subsp. enterica serovar Braenderup]
MPVFFLTGRDFVFFDVLIFGGCTDRLARDTMRIVAREEGKTYDEVLSDIREGGADELTQIHFRRVVSAIYPGAFNRIDYLSESRKYRHWLS